MTVIRVILPFLMCGGLDANDANLPICPYLLNFDPARSALTKPVHGHAFCTQIRRNSFQLSRHSSPVLRPATLFFDLFPRLFVQRFQKLARSSNKAAVFCYLQNRIAENTGVKRYRICLIAIALVCPKE